MCFHTPHPIRLRHSHRLKLLFCRFFYHSVRTSYVAQSAGSREVLQTSRLAGSRRIPHKHWLTAVISSELSSLPSRKSRILTYRPDVVQPRTPHGTSSGIGQPLGLSLLHTPAPQAPSHLVPALRNRRIHTRCGPAACWPWCGGGFLRSLFSADRRR